MNPTQIKALLCIFAVSSCGFTSAFGGGPGQKLAKELKPGEVLIAGRKASASKLIAKIKASDNQAEITKAKTAIEAAGFQISETLKLKSVKGVVILNTDEKKGATTLSAEQLSSKTKELQKTGLFEYVQPSWIVSIQKEPTDSAFVDGTLWGLRNTGQNGGTAGVDINVVPVWPLTTGVPTVVVAVIDTGVRLTHQDLKAQLWKNSKEIEGNAMDDDQNGYIDDIYGINAIDGTGNPMDDHSHGSHCAGTIAATANNGYPHVGVAYNVRIMALKFLDAGGSGNTIDAVKCIDYAIAMGAHVMSNSWGGGGFDQVLEDVIKAAGTADILFVAAAGNDGSNNDDYPTYPACYNVPNVIAVAAVNRTGALSDFSNYGPRSVHLGAPGEEIYSSTAIDDTSYDSWAGTSMATPHVAGVAALVKSLYSSASSAEVKGRVLSTRPLASLAATTITGGMLDAHRALSVAPDGVLELRATAASAPLPGGSPANFFVSVTDVVPVTGASVTGGLGSAAAVPFLDNGATPDATADDGVYSATINVPLGSPLIDLLVSATAPNSAPATATFSFPVLIPAPNDHYENRAFLPAGTTEATGHNRGATAQQSEPINPGPNVAGNKSVWWEWSPSVAGSATISTSGSNFDTTLAIYRGNGTLAGLALIGANDDTGDLTSEVVFDATVGEKYFVQINGFAGEGGVAAEGDILLHFPPPATFKSLIAGPRK